MITRRDTLKLGAAGLVAQSIGLSAPFAYNSIAQESSGSVQMFRANPARTGAMPGPGPSLNQPIVQLWKHSTNSGNVYASPTVVNNTVFVTVDASDSSPTLLAIDIQTGEARWGFSDRRTGSLSSPAFNDGTVFFGDHDGYLNAVDAESGERIWETDLGAVVFSSPLAVEGTVFVVSRDGKLVALDASTGDVRWSFDSGSESDASPSLSNGILCFANREHVYAINVETGEELWRTDSKYVGDLAAPIVDDIVYFGREDENGTRQTVGANIQTGEIVWSHDLQPFSSPAVHNNIMYLTNGESVVAIDIPSSSELWRFQSLSGMISSPGIADGIVYVGSSDNNLYAIDASNGEEIWRYTTDHHVKSSPAVVNGMVFVGSEDGSVYAFGNFQAATVRETIVLRAAPNTTALARAELEAGTALSSVGNLDMVTGADWVEISIDDQTGWVPQEAIEPGSGSSLDESIVVYTPAP